MSFCLISKIPLFELHQKWLIEIYNSYTKKNCYPIEFYLSLIFNYFICDVDSLNEVLISSKDQLLRYRNYNEIGITIPNFTFQILMENIDPEQIMLLIRLILLERKIIFVKSDCNNNAMIIESLLQLICPL